MIPSENKSYITKLWYDIQKGDKYALAELFEDQYVRLYNYGRKFSNTELLVEDAIQDVFISIWQSHNKLADVSSVESYVLLSFRRRLIRLINKERKMINKLPVVEPDINFIPEEFHFDDDGNNERHEILVDALNKLPARRKEVLYLHFYNGMDYEEISQIMNLHIQTVRNYVSKALITVRNILSDGKIPRLLSYLVIFITYIYR
ncbi:MAG TPA: sigma-70 family RNA polymerase sigma factor [Balneolales bacterium]|nr:sigma-70 family RNA polymerase sigma factor [Balneolales bacterium]